MSCETSSSFDTLKLKIDGLLRVFLLKLFLQSSKNVIFAKLPPLFKALTKCCPCHEFWHCVIFAQPWHCDSWNSTVATSPNAAPATKIDDPAAQSAAPATNNRHANWDTLVKYCACHARRKRNRNACHKTQQNRWFCHILWAPPNGEAQRPHSTSRCGRLRTTLGEHDSNLQTSRIKREPFAAHSGKRGAGGPRFSGEKCFHH